MQVPARARLEWAGFHAGRTESNGLDSALQSEVASCLSPRQRPKVTAALPQTVSSGEPLVYLPSVAVALYQLSGLLVSVIDRVRDPAR